MLFRRRRRIFSTTAIRDDTLASDNVFAAVNSLRVALANNDQPGISAAIASIKSAQDYLSQQLAFYGGVQNQITNALDVAQKFQFRIRLRSAT